MPDFLPERLAELKVEQPGFCWEPDADHRNVCILEAGHRGSCGWDRSGEKVKGVIASAIVSIRHPGLTYDPAMHYWAWSWAERVIDDLDDAGFRVVSK